MLLLILYVSSFQYFLLSVSSLLVLLLILSLTESNLPGGPDDKASACNAGDPGLIPGSGRPLGGGHDIPFQYSCLENPMDRGAWQATVHRVTQSST